MIRGRLTAWLAGVQARTEEANRQAILRCLLPAPGGWLVDLGCGDGDFTLRLVERTAAARITGLEMLEDRALLAQARGIDVIRADLEAGLPFADGSLDVVHANQVIEHVRDTDLLLREIRRVLAPRGQAVLSTNNLAAWHNVVSLLAGLQPPPAHVSDEVIVGNPLSPAEGSAGARGHMHLRLFTGRALRELAAHHGLALEHAETVGLYPLPPRAARLLLRLTPAHGAFLVQRYSRRAGHHPRR